MNIIPCGAMSILRKWRDTWLDKGDIQELTGCSVDTSSLDHLTTRGMLSRTFDGGVKLYRVRR